MAYLAKWLENKDVKQAIFCSEGSAVAAFCLANQIEHQTAREVFAVNPIFAWRLAQFAISNDATIIHVHDSHAHTFAVLAATLFGLKAKIVVSRRVDFPVKNSIFSKWKYNHRAIAKIICVSNKIKEITAPAIVRKNVLTTVYSGIDTSRFSETLQQAEIRSTLDIPSHSLLVGNVAALAPHKDYKTFIEAAKLIKSKRNDVHFLIIGDGPLRNEVKQWVLQSGIKSHIHLLGFREDVPQLLKALQVFMISSETEGLGTSILDAFASEVPVVATEAGGIPELVMHGKTGYLAPVKSPEKLAAGVLEILSNKAFADQLVQGATSHLKSFTKESMAASTRDEYIKLL